MFTDTLTLYEWIGLIRVLSRFVLGSYFLFVGVNGVFQFVSWPAPQPDLQKFLSEFNQVKGFMFTVKVGQILLGLSLLLGWALGLSFILLGILIFGISSLQIQLNGKAGKTLGWRLLILWIVTAALHWNEIIKVFFV